MIVDKYGRVAGSIDLAALAQMYAECEDDDLKAHYREVAAESGVELGEQAPELVEPEPNPEPEPDDREDGVYSVGGGWHEVVVNGAVIDKVRGADAAQDVYEEATGGDDNVP
jgi:hypothetical protein